jgi:hypothetical protein
MGVSLAVGWGWVENFWERLKTPNSCPWRYVRPKKRMFSYRLKRYYRNDWLLDTDPVARALHNSVT